MKWYQPIECDNTVKNPLVCDYDNLIDYGFSENDFFSGKAIDNWKPGVVFKAIKFENDGDPDDALPIYSERLTIDLQKEKIVGLQYLPIDVQRPNDDILKGFNLINILYLVTAFDYNKSDYNVFKDDFPNPSVRGKLAGVMKFVLIESALTGKDIIRLAEYKRRFFISEKIMEIFKNHKFTGYSFRQIELT
jgi:hypothetical protein